MIRLYLALGAAAALLAAVAGAYVTGRSHGYENGRIEQMEETLEAYRQRQEIEDEVDGMDGVAVCIELGGLPDQCEQLRGVDATAGSE